MTASCEAELLLPVPSSLFFFNSMSQSVLVLIYCNNLPMLICCLRNGTSYFKLVMLQNVIETLFPVITYVYNSDKLSLYHQPQFIYFFLLKTKIKEKNNAACQVSEKLQNTKTSILKTLALPSTVTKH